MRVRLLVSLTTVSAFLTLAACGSHGSSGPTATPVTVLAVAPSGAEFTSIQAAIDAALPGDRIEVRPGAYVESAPDRSVLGGAALYQFGLFVGSDKTGVTIQGVDALGNPVRNWTEVVATITTDATNNFGPSGIFVEADGVTIAGLGIGENLSGQNKTIEVIGDAFSLLDCDVSDAGGSVYFDDWRFDDVADASHVRAYRIEGNRFAPDVTIDLADGAGYSGDVLSRQIVRNALTATGYRPSISFNGSGTGVPWFVHSVGGAVIRLNSFVNTFATADADLLQRQAHIRARGDYDNSQFDWMSWWSENQFNHAYVVGPKPLAALREYSYAVGTYHYDHVRRIGAIFDGEQAHVLAGDIVLSK